MLGGGPAGLAAAIRLLERGGRDVSVRLLTQGHLLGGKASTHRDEDGFTWEHGFHVFFGFYTTLWGLLRRAGVDTDAVFTRNRGFTHFATDGGFDTFRLAVNPLVTALRLGAQPGMSGSDRWGMLRFAGRWAGARARRRDIEDLDDICFAAWAADMGLSPAMVDSPRVRFTAEGYFNDPHPISAFVVMRSVQLLSRDRRAADYYYQRVGLSEGVYEPLGAYFERLGGTLERYRKVVGLARQGRRIIGVEVAEPDPTIHVTAAGCGQPWGPSVPVFPHTRRWIEDFDVVVCTLPRRCVEELEGDLLERPALAGLRHLRDVVTLSLQAFLDHPCPSRRFGAINGLGPPLPLAVDYQQLRGRWATDPAIRCTLSWVGQLAGFEDRTNSELLAGALEGAERAGFTGAGDATPVRWGVRRNQSRYDTFALTEPGALRYRPPPAVGLENLWLAGDWVRNELDIPCMEAAARSGFEAADLALAGA